MCIKSIDTGDAHANTRRRVGSFSRTREKKRTTADDDNDDEVEDMQNVSWENVLSASSPVYVTQTGVTTLRYLFARKRRGEKANSGPLVIRYRGIAVNNFDVGKWKNLRTTTGHPDGKGKRKMRSS